MSIELPTLAAGMTVLLGFFAPYAIGLLNGILPFVKKSWHKKTVTVIVAALLAALVLVFYYVMTGDLVPAWPVLVVLSLLAVSASYALVTKGTAAKVEQAATRTAGEG